MSCCGKMRNKFEVVPKLAPAVPGASPPTSAVAALAPANGVEFEYLGGSVLSVIGQGTGLQYRFVGHGAKLEVDRRDRASLAAVPQLRAVGLRR